MHRYIYTYIHIPEVLHKAAEVPKERHLRDLQCIERSTEERQAAGGLFLCPSDYPSVYLSTSLSAYPSTNLSIYPCTFQLSELISIYPMGCVSNLGILLASLRSFALWGKLSPTSCVGLRLCLLCPLFLPCLGGEGFLSRLCLSFSPCPLSLSPFWLVAVSAFSLASFLIFFLVKHVEECLNDFQLKSP